MDFKKCPTIGINGRETAHNISDIGDTINTDQGTMSLVNTVL